MQRILKLAGALAICSFLAASEHWISEDPYDPTPCHYQVMGGDGNTLFIGWTGKDGKTYLADVMSPRFDQMSQASGCP